MNDAIECITAFASINLTVMMATADIISSESICANIATLAATTAIPAVILFVSNEMAMYEDIKRYNMSAIWYVTSFVGQIPNGVKKEAYKSACRWTGLGTNSNDFNDYILSNALKVGMLATKTRAFQRLIKHRQSTRR